MGAALFLVMGTFYFWYYIIFAPSINRSSTPKIAYANSYDAYKGSVGYISTNDIESGIKLSSSYDKEVSYIAEYAHTTFDFTFQPELAKEGKPISVSEQSIEKIISLKDNVLFSKS